MKASELRIGNWVYREYLDNDGNHIGEYQVSAHDIEHLDVSGVFHQDGEATSIPLTEDWLEKFGFYGKYKSVHCHWSKNGVGIEQASNVDDDENTISPSPQEFYYDFNFPIKYVHQLQNLYFALTGDELSLIKEQKD